ncbi:MAG: glycosyltransferase family 9 protein [Chloroflexi bacterium]|nr:glycosyltransferase family 9 protein [Chloroflexota bacterium]
MSERDPNALPRKRILAIKLADIGDVLLTLPALQSVRADYPDALIDILVPPGSAQLAEMSPVFNEVIRFDKSPFDSRSSLLDPSGFVQVAGLLRRLRARQYTELILLHHLNTRWGALKHAFLVKASGAPVRIGLDNGRGWFLNRSVRDRGFGDVHETEYWQELAAAAGVRSPATRPELKLSEDDRQWAKGFVGSHSKPGQPMILVHPGSGTYSLARRWYPHRFAAVADSLVRDHGAQVVLVGGPDEVELCGTVSTFMVTTPVLAAGQTTLGRMLTLLEAASLLVGNDSGLMHLAAAVGTPAVAIFGPSNDRAWRPYDWNTGRASTNATQSRYAVVKAKLKCRPCLYTGHRLGRREGCAGRECLNMITAAEVLEAARHFLSGAHQGESPNRPD